MDFGIDSWMILYYTLYILWIMLPYILPFLLIGILSMYIQKKQYDRQRAKEEADRQALHDIAAATRRIDEELRRSAASRGTQPKGYSSRY
jgi:thiamine transporter ThiT